MNSSRSLRGTQLTLQFPKILWSICCASCVALAGCAGIGQSLHVNSTVLVKVPIDKPVPSGTSRRKLSSRRWRTNRSGEALHQGIRRLN